MTEQSDSSTDDSLTDDSLTDDTRSDTSRSDDSGANDSRSRTSGSNDSRSRTAGTQDTLPGAQGSPEKDPQDWTTGDEPMTGPQASYLQTLAREAGEDVPGDLTKAEASEHIDRLQEKTGRGS